MECPACLTVLWEAPGRCPVCGADLTRADIAASTSVDRVDTIVEGKVREAAPDGEPLEAAAAIHPLTVLRPAEPPVPPLQPASRLPAPAWPPPALPPPGQAGRR